MNLFSGRNLVCVRGERRVFAKLVFDLAPGGALLLSGPNGSGKSSLLRLMAGLLPPAGGTLMWDGAPITDDPEAHRARLRYVGHLNAIKPVLTTAENITFFAGLAGAGKIDVERALAGFALTPLAHVAGRLLSSGQRRRVALARLLASPGDLWLLDEPSVGLDQASLAHLSKAIATHRGAGGRVAVATHTPIDIPDAQSLSLSDFVNADPVAGGSAW
ncbi:MAG: heme ABC exporter ATP-binding protein CcmA [Alphaproteobacteria bacterium]